MTSSAVTLPEFNSMVIVCLLPRYNMTMVAVLQSD